MKGRKTETIMGKPVSIKKKSFPNKPKKKKKINTNVAKAQVSIIKTVPKFLITKIPKSKNNP